jgi:hypothetical protein
MKMITLLIVLALTCLTSSCGGPSIGRRGVEELKTPIVIDAQIDETLEVSAGERMFVRGSMFEIDCLKMNSGIESKMDGYMGVDFDFAITATVLTLAFQTKHHLYYAAPPETITATYNGASVFGAGDFAGIREDKVSETLAWFIDNSKTNLRSGYGGDWVWTRPYQAEVEFERTRTKLLDTSGEWVALYYAGHYDGKVHFELEEATGPDANTRRDFQFNLNGDKSPTRIALKGFKLDIISVDNVSLTYRWVSID